MVATTEKRRHTSISTNFAGALGINKFVASVVLLYYNINLPNRMQVHDVVVGRVGLHALWPVSSPAELRECCSVCCSMETPVMVMKVSM